MHRPLARSFKRLLEVEQLEDRTLFSLDVLGTNGNDIISIDPVGQSAYDVMFTVNGTVSGTFRPSGTINIRALAGDDRIIVAAGVYLPTVIDGGPGRDTIQGGSGDDFIRARDGEPDMIDGGLGIDKVDADSVDLVTQAEFLNPFQDTLDNQVQDVKVLVLNYDPLIPSEGNQRLWQVFGWNDPHQLALGYEADLERASGGALELDIVGWRDLNEFPTFVDGYRYSPAEYVQNRRTNTGWHNSQIDFPRIVTEQGLVALVDSGQVDEVWLFGDHFFIPVIGESWMAGPDSFYINGPTFPQIPSRRPFACFGFSYERGVAEMLHDTGHRTEATMNRIYGGWDFANPTSNWDRFSANVDQFGGAAGIGTTHWPANASGGYDTSNQRIVQSWADDFFNYPNMTWVTTPINSETWSHGPRHDYERDYQKWYYTHFPRAAGINGDGKQNNWWKYLYDFNNYTADGQPKPLVATSWAEDLYNLDQATYTFDVTFSGATPLKVGTLDDNDLVVTGPNGFSQPARLSSVSDATDGTYRVGHYTIHSPGNAWLPSERGTYTIVLQSKQISDIANQFLAGGVLGAFKIRSATGNELDNDTDSLLLLHFNGNLNGAAGETPSANTDTTFVPGRMGEAAHMGTLGSMAYGTAGNINAGEGTIEFWIKPDWNGTGNGGHTFFQAGQEFNNGMVLAIDGADNLRFILWGDDPATPAVETGVERGIGFSGADWVADHWYHLAATWNGATGQLAFYVNGQLVGSANNSVNINSFSGNTMQIGSDINGGSPAVAAFDEFRISGRARVPDAVRTDYNVCFSVNALAIDVNAIAVPLGEDRQMRAIARDSSDTTRDVTDYVIWSSSNPAVASISPGGLLSTVAVGSATITAQFDTLRASSSITVTASQSPQATGGPYFVQTFGSTSYDVTIQYIDSIALDLSTIRLGNLLVRGPGGYSTFAPLQSITSTNNSSPWTAVYRFTPPGGYWDPSDNGTYTLIIQPGQVRNIDGNYSSTAKVFQLLAVIARPPLVPTPSFNSLPTWSPATFTVSWSASDWSGSGIAFYDVAISDNDGPITPWLTRTTQTSLTFTGQDGNTYRFYVWVTDNEGNRGGPAQTVTRTYLSPYVLPDIKEDSASVKVRVANLVAQFGPTPFGYPIKSKGIAVTQMEGSGTWRYSPNNGLSWGNVPAIASGQGFLLPSSYLIYFVPARNWHGEVNMIFRAWNGNGGTARTLVPIRDGVFGSPFSESSGLVTLTVSPVNDTPYWSSTRINLPRVVPGSTPPGDTVAHIFGSYFRDADGDNVGVAISGQYSYGRGTWQYSTDEGANWIDVGPVSLTSDLLLDGSAWLRFLPNSSVTAGAVALKANAWDGTRGTATQGATRGTANLYGSCRTGGSTAFSATRTLLVDYVNTAPTLGSDIGPVLPATTKNHISQKISVSTLLTGMPQTVTDPDKGALLGIAIVGASGPGTWQYSLDNINWWSFGSDKASPLNGVELWQYLLNGETWWGVGNISESLGGLLPSSASLRFVPAKNQTGTATLVYRAWDQTAGNSGQLFTIGATGKAEAFSSLEATAILKVI